MSVKDDPIEYCSLLMCFCDFYEINISIKFLLDIVQI